MLLKERECSIESRTIFDILVWAFLMDIIEGLGFGILVRNIRLELTLYDVYTYIRWEFIQFDILYYFVMFYRKFWEKFEF